MQTVYIFVQQACRAQECIWCSSERRTSESGRQRCTNECGRQGQDSGSSRDVYTECYGVDCVGKDQHGEEASDKEASQGVCVCVCVCVCVFTMRLCEVCVLHIRGIHQGTNCVLLGQTAVSLFCVLVSYVCWPSALMSLS